MNPLYEYEQWKKEGYPASVGEWEDWAERIVKSFRAELEAAKKDFDRIGQLLLEQDTLKAERDEALKAYADECATNVYLKSDLDVAMNENQRLTKIVEDYASIRKTTP